LGKKGFHRRMSLANAIMTALIEDELTGYELAQRFETSLGFFLARVAPTDLPRAQSIGQ
jgi:DNA-binding PadR family transcriptional regulator